jgi:hypothetical protein
MGQDLFRHAHARRGALDLHLEGGDLDAGSRALRIELRFQLLAQLMLGLELRLQFCDLLLGRATLLLEFDVADVEGGKALALLGRG